MWKLHIETTFTYPWSSAANSGAGLFSRTITIGHRAPLAAARGNHEGSPAVCRGASKSKGVPTNRDALGVRIEIYRWLEVEASRELEHASAGR